jgi:serine/threonine-protein kinase
VTDFGVAKALSAARSGGGDGGLALTGMGGTTSTGLAIGTPAYMAPEQLAADPAADHRMDLYAAGLLAYELCTGVSPFVAESPRATLAAQLTRMPEPLHRVRPEVPERSRGW